MKPDDALLNVELRRDEGVRYEPYLDTVGIKTVGVGHNLKAVPLPAGWAYPLTDAQVNELLAADLKVVFDGLDARIPWWRNLAYPRQRALANMAFQLGITGLMGFSNTLAAIQQGHYIAAASGMRASKWATQAPKRAERMIALMLDPT